MLDFKSQYGQDKYLVEKILPGVKQGVYVDIGAHDGVDRSNTWVLEQIGWSGVCVEPLPWVFESLSKNRSCECINAAVSGSYEDTVEFCAIEGYSEMLSGIISNYSEEHKLRILSESQTMGSTRRKITVKNKRFDQLSLPTNIDFVSIDTEGSELEILQTIDFETYHIKVIMFESNYNEPIPQYVLDHYNVLDRIQCDIVLVRK